MAFTPENGFEFEVTDEEVERMRSELSQFAGSAALQCFSDVYLRKVMAASSSNDSEVRRTFDYSKDKLLKVLRWRAENDVDKISQVSLENTKCASLYWYGYDHARRPILWARPQRKDYDNLNVENQLLLHIQLIEQGIKLMPRGVTDFTIVADARGKTPPLKLVRGMINLLSTGYPDRLHLVIAGPSGMLVRMLFSTLRPFMPRRLVDKIALFEERSAHDVMSSKFPPRFIPPCFSPTGSMHPWDDPKDTQGIALGKELDMQEMVEIMNRIKLEIESN